MTSGRPAGPAGHGRAVGLGALPLLATALGLNVGWRLLVGLSGALGTDAALWGLAAEGLLHGAQSPVPPLYPGLLALLRMGALPLPAAGTTLAIAAGSLVPAATMFAAQQLGARRGAAVVAGAASLLLPDLAAWSNELSPNSMVALGLVAATGLWARALATTDRRPALAAVLFTGLLPLLRETGVILALAAPVLLIFGRRQGWRLALALIAIWWLSPLIFGVLPGPTPLATPWGARGGMALAGLAPGDGPLPNYVAEIAPAERVRYVAWLRDGAVLRVAAWHLQRSLRLAPGGWLIALSAALLLVGSAGRRRRLWAGLLPLATIAPALLLWTQRRHVLLAVPALLAVLAAATSPASPARPTLPPSVAGRRWRKAMALLALVGLAWTAASWPAALDEQRGASRRAASLAELGALICAQTDPRPARLLGGPIQDVGLYCPLPRHDPDGSAADALTALVLPVRTGPGPLPPGWAPTGRRIADIQVFRLVESAVQPCADAVPEPGTPFLSTGPVHATLVGCERP